MTNQNTPGTATSTVEVSEVEGRVLAEVADMLRDVIGEEYVVDMEITMDTSFNTDLEMESIEFVTLAEAMRERYGDMVDFVGFLAEMDVDQVINMEVGEVVEFIARCLTSGDPTGGHDATMSPSASGGATTMSPSASGGATTMSPSASGGATKDDRAAFGESHDRAAFGESHDRAAFGESHDRAAFGESHDRFAFGESHDRVAFGPGN